jgi:hypothetical protein
VQTPATIAPLVISVIAVLISAVSAWNNTRQIRRTQRTRLGELIDAITKADADYDKELVHNDYVVHEIIVADHNVRQEILVRQALPLAGVFRRNTSSRELTVLAGTLARIHDFEAADRLYVQALAIARREGPVYLSMVHQDYGNFLFDVGNPEEGSVQLQRAADVLPVPRGDRALQRRFQCLGMRAVRHAEHRYQLNVAQGLIKEAGEILDKVRTQDYRDEMRSDLDDYKAQLKEALGTGSSQRDGQEIKSPRRRSSPKST